MKRPTTPTCLLSLLLLTVPLACDSGAADESGSPTGSEEESGSETLYDYSTTLQDLASGANLAGGEVCVDARGDLACATSAADGMVTVQIPEGPNALVINREGYIPALFCGVGTQDVSGGIYQLVGVDTLALLASQIGVEEDTSAGHFGTFAPTDGMTLTLEPEAGTKAYLNDLNLPDLNLEATSAAGGVGIANIPPGHYTATLAHPTKTCTSPNGWESEGSKVKFEVRAGHISAIPSIVCE